MLPLTTDTVLGEPVTVDKLVGTWQIHQLERGHRFSSDDILTAWMALRHHPTALRQLDLGAGIGSVGLTTLWSLPDEATLTMLEAQEVSHHLAKATVDLNGLQERVTLLLGDLRDAQPERQAFDLVTGSPPYIPVGKGVSSPHTQRAHCRMEMRGDIADYAAAAARALAPGGTFTFCHAAGDPRPEAAITAAGLVLVERIDVYFRAGRDPTIALFACRHEGQALPRGTFTIRDEKGEYTGEYHDMRDRIAAPSLRR